MLPRDFTKQENLCSSILSDMGLKYQEQAEFGRYTVDFFLPEIDTVIEIDGPYGHLRKADRKRDAILVNEFNIWKVVHISSTKRKEMEEEIRKNISMEVVFSGTDH